MRTLAGAILFIVLSLGAASAAEWNLYSPCRDIGLSDREIELREVFDSCNPEKLRNLHVRFAAPELRGLAGRGGSAVRITITDGYGNDRIIIETFRVARGAAPRVVVRGRGDGERRAPESIEAELDADAWEAIARGASALERVPAMSSLFEEPRPTEEDDEVVTICLHAWSAIIETVGFGQPRVIARGGCDEERDIGPFEFAWRVMEHAFDAFPACEWLDRQYFRNNAARLEFCLGLSGEITVAASATNAIRPFMYDRFASEHLRHVLADDFALTLNGETPVTGADAAFARLRALAASGDYEFHFDTASGAEGERGLQTAQLNLLLIDDAWTEEGQTRFAEVTQTWRREDDLWLLGSAQVGPWQVITFEDDD